MTGSAKHRCPGPGCTVQLGRSTLACRPHWYQVDPATRREVSALWVALRKDDVDSLRSYLRARAEAMRQMRPLPTAPGLPS